MLLQAQVITLGVGEISLPNGFVHKRIGMTGSSMGEIRRSNGPLLISYDIGPLAGTHMHPRKRGECRWFQERTTGGRKIYMGMVEEQGQRGLIVTVVMDEGSEPPALPANFRATVRSKRDIADVKKIAASYKPAQRK